MVRESVNEPKVQAPAQATHTIGRFARDETYLQPFVLVGVGVGAGVRVEHNEVHLHENRHTHITNRITFMQDGHKAMH